MEKTEELTVGAPRAASPGAGRADAKAAELYARILGDLPVFPPLAIRLAELAGGQDAKVDEVVDLLCSDAAFSADLLRRANSPAYGFSSRIDTLQQALVLLGFDELRRIALAAAARGFAGPALQWPELRLCWRHSLAVALLSEELARGTAISPEQAYTAGVMHDIGRLGLLTARPNDFAQLLSEAEAAGPVEDSSYFLDREAEVFGFDHTEAGRWLAERWEIPLDLRAVAGRHHDRPSSGELDLLVLVQYAVTLADALGFGVVEAMARRRPSELAREAPAELAGGLERNPDELAELLASRIDALDGPGPAEESAPAPVVELPVEREADTEVQAPLDADAVAEQKARSALPWAIGAVAALAAALAYLMLST